MCSFSYFVTLLAGAALVSAIDSRSSVGIESIGSSLSYRYIVELIGSASTGTFEKRDVRGLDHHIIYLCTTNFSLTYRFMLSSSSSSIAAAHHGRQATGSIPTYSTAFRSRSGMRKTSLRFV